MREKRGKVKLLGFRALSFYMSGFFGITSKSLVLRNLRKGLVGQRW